MSTAIGPQGDITLRRGMAVRVLRENVAYAADLDHRVFTEFGVIREIRKARPGLQSRVAVSFAALGDLVIWFDYDAPVPA